MNQIVRFGTKPHAFCGLSSLFAESRDRRADSQYILSATSRAAIVRVEGKMIRSFRGRAPEISIYAEHCVEFKNAFLAQKYSG